jgi:putative DNA primase/helicase
MSGQDDLSTLINSARNGRSDEEIERDVDAVIEKAQGPSLYFDKSRFVAARLALKILSNDSFLTFKDTHEIYCYDKDAGIYRDDGADLIRQQVQERLGDRISNHYKNEVVEYIRDASLIDREEVEPPRKFIPLRDGFLDVLTNELHDYTPEVPFFFMHKGAYKPEIIDVETEASEFIASTFPSDDDISQDIDESDESHVGTGEPQASDVDIIQEVAGACFYRRSLYKKALMLVGGGDNGKSLFLSLLVSAVGNGAVSTRTIYDINNTRFASADLYHKTANVQADIGGGELAYTGRFKTLTGGDLVSAEHKGQPSFNFVNESTMIFSTNDLPKIKHPDSVFYDRWILIEMACTFVENPINANEREVDPFLEDKLSEQIEIDWFTTWAIVGLKRLLENGRYSVSDSSMDIKKRWVSRTDSLHAFVKLHVTESPGNRVTKQAFYEAYRTFCGEEFEPETIMLVGRRLPGLVKTRTIETRPKSWLGIAVTSIAPQGEVKLGEFDYASEE